MTAIILAGGLGRRVGEIDKGWLNWKDEPLITHTYKRVCPQVSRVIISCNRNLDRYSNLVDTAVIDNRSGYCGPLAGIEAAGRLVKTRYTLVVPCDAPELPDDLVQRLIMPFELGNDIEITYVWDGSRQQFLFTIFKNEILSKITICLDNGGRSLREWHELLKTHLVDFSDKPNSFKNINYKSQLLE